jgi:hypothetical protein
VGSEDGLCSTSGSWNVYDEYNEIKGANHVDLPNQVNLILFAKLTEFFQKHLS